MHPRLSTLPRLLVVAGGLILPPLPAPAEPAAVAIELAQSIDEIIEALNPQGAPPPRSGPTTREAAREHTIEAPPRPVPPNRGSAMVAPSGPMPPATGTAGGESAIDLTIEFGIDSAALTPQATALLDRLGAGLDSPALRDRRLRIAGHADATGAAEYNLGLSQRRAEAVRAYLAERFGLAPERLDSIGLGATQPLDPATPQNPANRRVHITAAED